MDDVLPAGTRLGRYEIVQRLALGGMAEIYLARMAGLAGFAKHVVLKRILPTYAKDAEFVRMFFNEARYAATLDHPNIAHVYDLGEEAGLHYFTMEYLHGDDCRAFLRTLASTGKALPLEHALTIVVAAASGCHFAHELTGDDGTPLGLVHRDVSPSNVVVTYAGAVKLVDFGIAKATRLEDATAVGVTKGKLAYMAPEQCKGLVLDRRVDVYALGVLLYELTTQRRAFAGQNDAQIMWQVVSGEVAWPLDVVPGYPPALDAILRRAMHIDREQRYGSARELQQAIEAFAREAGLALGATGLAEFFAETMGTRLEPWRVEPRPARVTTPVPPGELPRAPAPRPPTQPSDDPFAPQVFAPLPAPSRPASVAPTPPAGTAALSSLAAAPAPAPLAVAPTPTPWTPPATATPPAGAPALPSLDRVASDAPTLVPQRAATGAAAAVEAPGRAPIAPPGPQSGSVPALAVFTQGTNPGSAGAGRGARLPWIVAGVVVVAAAATVIAVMAHGSRRRDDAGVTLVAERGTAVVEGIDAAAGAIEAAAAGPVDAGAAPAPSDARAAGTAAGSQPGSAGSGKPRPAAGGDPLQAAFARRQGAVEACFKQHAATVVRASKVTLRFEIDAAGVPTQVTVLPADLGATPLGACIADVGRSTRFPAQPAPTAFRIDVSVRASPAPGGT